MKWETVFVTRQLDALCTDREMLGYVGSSDGGGFDAVLFGTMAHPGNEIRWFETQAEAKAWLVAVTALEAA